MMSVYNIWFLTKSYFPLRMDLLLLYKALLCSSHFLAWWKVWRPALSLWMRERECMKHLCVLLYWLLYKLDTGGGKKVLLQGSRTPAPPQSPSPPRTSCTPRCFSQLTAVLCPFFLCLFPNSNRCFFTYICSRVCRVAASRLPVPQGPRGLALGHFNIPFCVLELAIFLHSLGENSIGGLGKTALLCFKQTQATWHQGAAGSPSSWEVCFRSMIDNRRRLLLLLDSSPCSTAWAVVAWSGLLLTMLPSCPGTFKGHSVPACLCVICMVSS